MKKNLTYLGLLFVTILFSGQACVSFTGGNSTPATSGPAGMFKSTDKGDTWKQINALPKADGVKSISSIGVYHIFEDPQDPAAMYLATRANGLVYSYDDGNTWQQPAGPLASGFIYSVAVHPKNKCEIYVTNGPQIFKTTDCSRSWTEMFRESRSGVRVVSLAYNPFFPNQIIMGEDNGDVLRSADDGKSWMILTRLGTQLSEIMADPLQESVMYIVSRNNGLYRSTDSGTSWGSIKSKLSAFSGALEYRRFVINPQKSNSIYWISTYGILSSLDGGESWTAMPLITPPGSANIYGFDINHLNDQEIYYTATINGRSTFYKSADGGKNWVTKKLPSGQIPTALRVRPGVDNVLFMGFTIPPSQ